MIKDYQALLDAVNEETVVGSVGRWLAERKRTKELIEPKIPSFAKFLNQPDLSYKTLLERSLPQGYEADQALLATDPKDFASILILTDRKGGGRSHFVEAMELVALEDARIIQSISFGRITVSSTGLRIWARARAAFAVEYAAKSERLRRPANRASLECKMTVRTVDPFSGAELQNYEVVSVLVFWDKDETKEVPFPKLSSPTSDRLEAGNYFVWCRRKVKTGHINGDKKLVRVADDVAVDVIAPSEVK